LAVLNNLSGEFPILILIVFELTQEMLAHATGECGMRILRLRI
jgi:hypothetical protein